MKTSSLDGWVHTALLAKPEDGRGDFALRAMLLAYAFWIPVSIVGAQVFGYGAVALGVWLAWRCRRRLDGAGIWGVLMVLFACFSIVGALAGPAPMRGLRKLPRLLLLLTVFAPAASMPINDMRRSLWALRLLQAFVAGATMRALYDVVRIGGAFVRGARGFELYDLGNMRDPQFYMCTVLVLIALGWPQRTGRKAFWSGAARVLAAGLTALALVLHFKRGVWFAFGIALLAVCGLCRRRLLLPAAIAAILLLALPPVRSRLAALRDEWSPHASRRILWTQVAPALMKDYPWGVGRGVLTNEDLRRHGRIREPKLTHLHNNLLQIAVETGWGGAAVWLVWMAVAAAQMIVNVRTRWGIDADVGGAAMGLAASFLGLHLNGLVEYNFGDAEIFMWFMLLMGMTLLLRPVATDQIAAPEPERMA